MSLVGTLGKLAMGVMVAKGVGKMMSGGAGGGLGGLLGGALGKAGGAGGLGGLLGGAQGGQAGGQSGGGLGDLGSLLGGGKTAGGAQLPGGMAGGLGGLLESISGGQAGGAQAGGAAAPAAPGGSMGDLLNSALKGESTPEPEPAQEAQAKILIQAMINAAKSDGKIDESEQQKIVQHLGQDISDADRQFVISEMQKPLDVDGFLKTVPPGTEAQVYMMSLMGIDLDTPEEARYLDGIRKAMNITEQQANALHTQLGAPTLYS